MLLESQKDLNRAQEVGQIGSWRMDIHRNILTWSDENHRIFGVPKETLLTYETFLATVHPDDRQYVETRWKASLRGERYDIEHRIVINDQVKWVREKAYLELDNAGEPISSFGSARTLPNASRWKRRCKKARRGSILQ
jgi:PAS domain-containing protein